MKRQLTGSVLVTMGLVFLMAPMVYAATTANSQLTQSITAGVI